MSTPHPSTELMNSGWTSELGAVGAPERLRPRDIIPVDNPALLISFSRFRKTSLCRLEGGSPAQQHVGKESEMVSPGKRAGEGPDYSGSRSGWQARCPLTVWTRMWNICTVATREWSHVAVIEAPRFVDHVCKLPTWRRHRRHPLPRRPSPCPVSDPAAMLLHI